MANKNQDAEDATEKATTDEFQKKEAAGIPTEEALVETVADAIRKEEKNEGISEKEAEKELLAQAEKQGFPEEESKQVIKTAAEELSGTPEEKASPEAPAEETTGTPETDESSARLAKLREMEQAIIRHRLANFDAAQKSSYGDGGDESYGSDGQFDEDRAEGLNQGAGTDSFVSAWGGQRDRIPMTIRIKPDGQMTIKTDLQRGMDLNIQVRPGGRIEIQTGGQSPQVQVRRKRRGRGRARTQQRGYGSNSLYTFGYRI